MDEEIEEIHTLDPVGMKEWRGEGGGGGWSGSGGGERGERGRGTGKRIEEEGPSNVSRYTV